MSDVLDYFSVSNLRRYARYALFLGKWLMRLLSAGVEAFLRSNFGRRYVHMLSGAFLLCLTCSAFYPRPGLLTNLFVFGLLARIIQHYFHVFHRRRHSVTEPLSSSAGDSWKFWNRFGYTKATIWLKLSAVALFIKEQISRFRINRRIIDSVDAKVEAQTLNSSLKQYQPGPGQGAQKSHRAHFPRSGHHPNP